MPMPDEGQRFKPTEYREVVERLISLPPGMVLPVIAESIYESAEVYPDVIQALHERGISAFCRVDIDAMTLYFGKHDALSKNVN